MKKILTMAISLLMIFSVAVVANAESASDCITNKYNNEPTAFSVFDYAENVTKTECIPIKGSSQTYTELYCEVTDAAVIQRLYEQGVIERNKDGTLPKKVSLTQLVLDDQKELQETKGGITISKTNYYDGRYFDEYDRYVVSGPCEFTQVYSRTSTASWNTSMSGSVNVGGTVYGIADVRASVSASMGYTIGNSYTKSSTYKVNVPNNKIWTIKVWTSYRVFTYTAKVGSKTIATGKAWYPNGLVILKTES